MRKAAACLLMVIMCQLFFADFALASNLTSGSFQILAPVFNSSGFSSSANYKLLGSFGQTLQGISSSGSFQLKQGFQYYPAPSAGGGGGPAPSPAPGPTGSGGGPILDIFKYLYHLIIPCSGADLNCDGRVDILDAGILFYWWGRPLNQPQVASALQSVLNEGRPSPDFNHDQSIDIFDLSILLSDWAG